MPCGVRANRETAERVSRGCLQWLRGHKSKLLPVWTFLYPTYFVTVRLPFNAACGDVTGSFQWRVLSDISQIVFIDNEGTGFHNNNLLRKKGWTGSSRSNTYCEKTALSNSFKKTIKRIRLKSDAVVERRGDVDLKEATVFRMGWMFV